MSKIIDLHIHSTNSDGQFTPKEIVELAKMNNVRLISITDHDNIKSATDLQKIKNLNISFINGVEISTITSIASKKIRIHLLGYGYDEKNDNLQKRLLKQKEVRETVNSEYLEKMCRDNPFLNSKILYDIDKGKYINFSKYINNYLIDNNYTNEEISKILNYMKENIITYDGYDIQDEEAISLLLGSGGISVLAHPYQYRLTEEEEIKLVHRLKAMGLKGIEIFHSGDTLDGMKLQKKICIEEGLLYSAGSDFHTDYDDYGNKIGLGKNNNLLIEGCSLEEELKRLNKIYR